MTNRIPTTCDQCGQTDDHPKVHIGEVTKHHDCLSHTEEQMVRDSSDHATTIIDVCKAGTRGDALLAHIDTIHQES